MNHACAVMEMFWEENCKKVPNANDPAEMHDFTDKANHTNDSLPDNPDVTKESLCLHMFSSNCTLH